MKQILKRLTYANVMSSIAVFLVLGGASAYAIKKVGSHEIKGNSITTGKLKREAVTTAKIKNSAVTTNKIKNEAVTSAKLDDGAVTTSKIANDAVTGDKVKVSSLPQVPKAAVAVSAESAQPEAFAQVNTNGSIETVNSKNILKSKEIGSGEYCVTANFTPRGGQVTPIFGGTGGTTAQLNIGTLNCPSPAVQVLTYSSGTTKGSLPFFIVLYR